MYLNFIGVNKKTRNCFLYLLYLTDIRTVFETIFLLNNFYINDNKLQSIMYKCKNVDK
jgi:hypothetical protein